MQHAESFRDLVVYQKARAVSRRFEKHFTSKLTDADGEQQETQHWIEIALDCAYLTEQTRDQLIDELERIGRMLQSMMEKAGQFCGPPACCVREETAEYFVTDDR